MSEKKDHSERGFIPKEMGILGHEIPDHGKINFPVMDYVRHGEIQGQWA